MMRLVDSPPARRRSSKCMAGSPSVDKTSTCLCISLEAFGGTVFTGGDPRTALKAASHPARGGGCPVSQIHGTWQCVRYMQRRAKSKPLSHLVSGSGHPSHLSPRTLRGGGHLRLVLYRPQQSCMFDPRLHGKQHGQFAMWTTLFVVCCGW